MVLCVVYPLALTPLHALTAAPRAGAARKASVEVITSARVTSIAHQGDHHAEESTSNAGGDDSFGKTQQQQGRFELSFTTATPLPPAMRKALGTEAEAIAGEKEPGSTAGGAGGRGSAESDGAASGSSGRSTSGSSKKSSYRMSCDFVLQATGAAREGHGWAKKLGHAVSAPVPSLFTLTVKDPR